MNNRTNILVVDDEDYIRDSVRIILESEGYNVVCAVNGLEALEILMDNRVDVVLSDIKMPEMDGLTLLSKIKEKYPDIEVILITGYPSIDAAIESIKMGAYDYVTKPFKIDELITKLERALTSKNLKREVIQLKQILSIYDTSKYLSSTLNHDEIFEKLRAIVIDELKVDGFLVDIYTKNIKYNNADALFSSYIEDNYSFKKLFLLFSQLEYYIDRFVSNGITYHYIIYPMFSKDGLWGIFCVYKKGSMASFSEVDIRVINIYISQCSLALQNSISFEEVSKGYFETIKSLSNAVDAKDHYTRGHSENVKKYALMIVDEMGFNDVFREMMLYAGLLHDIGKIGVPTSIIIKPDKLTFEEYNEMKRHTVLGKEILEPIEFLGDVPYYVLYHHEKLDGSGYPFGLTDKEIPVGAKILQVADSYDAMTTDRSYRPRRNAALAFEELERCAGTQFDIDIVSAFKSAFSREG